MAALLHGTPGIYAEEEAMEHGLHRAPQSQRTQRANAAAQGSGMMRPGAGWSGGGDEVSLQKVIHGSERTLAAAQHRQFVTFEENERAWAEEFGQFVKGVAAKPRCAAGCMGERKCVHMRVPSLPSLV